MPRLASSMLSFAAYDDATRRLTLTFVTGERYDYFDVPRQVYLDLLAADSAGRYFDAAIRDRFGYQRRWR